MKGLLIAIGAFALLLVALAIGPDWSPDKPTVNEKVAAPVADHNPPNLTLASSLAFRTATERVSDQGDAASIPESQPYGCEEGRDIALTRAPDGTYVAECRVHLADRRVVTVVLKEKAGGRNWYVDEVKTP
ncbi:MAG: hypothetical protein BGO01_06765 [Armatimonadetes bacterium 55-13]|nr:hypothetical protein [Armatimonadota bacterium]OJU65174.1 MAG: hypothetical protein BGO01_06765 [Armatimonadetes bacterium 55-13]